MKIILDFNGSKEEFKKALDSLDNEFMITDTIFWLLDYGVEPNKISGDCIHHTEYGDIKITADTGLI